MSLAINTNPMALNTRHKLATTSMEMAKTLEKLSSGLRINRAADDAAGLAVSEKLRSQIRGTSQAMRNAQDGISMIQTAEGALVEVHDMLHRMRELAIQSANDTYSNDDRKEMNLEMQALRTEINAIASRTKFNGKELLSGSLSTKLDAASPIGPGFVVAAGTNTSVSAVDVTGGRAGTTYTFTDTATGLQLSDGTVTQEILDADLAIAADGSKVLDFNQLGLKITVSSVAGETGANVAAGIVAGGTDTIVTAAGSASANFQIGAGSGGVSTGDAMSVDFSRVDISSLGMASLDTELTQFNTAVTGGTFVTSDAEQLMDALDSAITFVNDRRGALGSVQNRLEHTVKSLMVSVENLTASESRIRDTDVATETSNMVRGQILTQAGTAVLAQANQVPQGALALLRGG
jgi:flagellin